MAESVLPYIMHRLPMVLIDHLVEDGEDFAVSDLTIRPDLIFAEEHGLPTWASIEIMAQTVSLYAGKQGQRNGNPPKVGFLLGTRKLKLPFSHFPYGAKLHIRAEKQYIEDGLGMFDCEIQMMNTADLNLSSDEMEKFQHPIQATLSVYEPVNDEVLQQIKLGEMNK